MSSKKSLRKAVGRTNHRSPRSSGRPKSSDHSSQKSDPRVLPRVAIHSITGCAGCQLTMYFIKDKLFDFLGAIDLVAAPMIKSNNDPGPYDICFVEGSVSSQRDLKHLQEWRKQSTVLVALGTCATHGNVQAMCNFRDQDQLRKTVYGNKPTNLSGWSTPIPSSPIEDHVAVDYRISGCPPDEFEIIRFVKQALMGMNPRIYNEPVCAECTKREIRCLLEDGKECFGPLIRGGCNALCPAVNHACTGCHGPLQDINLDQTIDLLKANGVPLKIINQHLQKYAGLAFEKLGAQLKE